MRACCRALDRQCRWTADKEAPAATVSSLLLYNNACGERLDANSCAEYHCAIVRQSRRLLHPISRFSFWRVPKKSSVSCAATLLEAIRFPSFRCDLDQLFETGNNASSVKRLRAGCFRLPDGANDAIIVGTPAAHTSACKTLPCLMRRSMCTLLILFELFTACRVTNKQACHKDEDV